MYEKEYRRKKLIQHIKSIEDNLETAKQELASL